MLFMYIHTHTPENCLMTKTREALRVFSDTREGFQRAGIKVVGAYVAQHEHTVFWTLEANDIHELEIALTPFTLLGTARLIPVDKMDYMLS
jgi:hypothetical protein